MTVPAGPPLARLEQMLAELDARNRDNVSRTASYLELYTLSREHSPELPWLLLAHFVSRNAGYMMTGLRNAMDDPKRIFTVAALEQLFFFLERANYLIFYDAWYHVVHLMSGRSDMLAPPRTARFVCDAYRRFAQSTEAQPGAERSLVLDLVTNEQNYIERRVVHRPEFATALGLVEFFEASGAERPLVFGGHDTGVRVGGFAQLERRIDAGMRLFDGWLADARSRHELYRWALDHPHTASRSDYGGRRGPSLSEAWPAEQVLTATPALHDPPEADSGWP